MTEEIISNLVGTVSIAEKQLVLTNIASPETVESVRLRRKASTGVSAATLFDVHRPFSDLPSTSSPGDSAPDLSSYAKKVELQVQTERINTILQGANAGIDTFVEAFNEFMAVESAAQALTNLVNTKAPIDSPDFTGTPQALTRTVGDRSRSLATTAFVGTEVALMRSTALLYQGGIVKGYSTVQAAINDANGAQNPIVEVRANVTETVTVSGTNVTIRGSGVSIGGLSVNGNASCKAFLDVLGLVNVTNGTLDLRGNVVFVGTGGANEAVTAGSNGTVYMKGDITVSGGTATVGGIGAATPFSSVVVYDGNITVLNRARAARNNQARMSISGKIFSNGSGIVGRNGTTDIYGIVDCSSASGTDVDGNGISLNAPVRWTSAPAVGNIVLTIHNSAELYSAGTVNSVIGDNNAVDPMIVWVAGQFKANQPVNSLTKLQPVLLDQNLNIDRTSGKAYRTFFINDQPAFEQVI